jgi:hypothetical protein
MAELVTLPCLISSTAHPVLDVARMEAQAAMVPRALLVVQAGTAEICTSPQQVPKR